MTRRRGFTLIECLICLGIMGLLIFPFLDMVEGVHRAYSTSMRTANLRSDVDRLGYGVVARLRRTPGYRIEAGNRGAALGAGQLRWHDQAVTLSEKGRARDLATNVTHFSLFRRDGLTTLTLELKDPVSGAVERRSFVVEKEGYATRI